MKNLLFFSILMLAISCTKEDPLRPDDRPTPDNITFSARSQKSKKGYYRGHLSSELNSAQGQVNFTFESDNSTVHFKLIVAQMNDITRAYLYHSHMDDNNAVLKLSGSVMGTTNSILVEGILTDADINCSCGDASHHTLANLRQHIENGETYVAVHSSGEDGDIQGIIQ